MPRATMVIATAGGMTTSTLLTLYVVPCVYAYVDRFSQWIRGSNEKAGRLEHSGKTTSTRTGGETSVHCWARHGLAGHP